MCVTCKPDFKDEPCIAFYSLSCIAINNRRREKVPDQGSPKCGIVGGDKIEVRGGSSKRVQEHAPPGNFENLQHL